MSCLELGLFRFTTSLAFLLISLTASLNDARHILLSSRITDNVVQVNSGPDLCLTPGCVKAADEILSNLDETVDPCDDFYRFACGGWMDRHAIPDDRSSVTISSEIDDDLNLKLRGLLEEELDGSEPRSVKMMKDMYSSCMDLNTIEETGAEPLKEVLKYFGGWPVVEGSEWKESNFDWIDSVISLRKLGYSHDILINIYVEPDFRNNTVHVIALEQASLGVPDRSYLMRGLSDSTTAAYFKKMVEAAKLLGAQGETAVEELLKAFHFETALAKISLPREEMRDYDKLYNKYTVEQLQGFVPQIPWLKYLNGIFSDDIYENDTVIISVPDFVLKFVDLISVTDKRVIANYMMWRVVDESMNLLSKEWRDIGQEYSSVITGESEESPRWEICLSSVTGSMYIALSSYYVKHYFKEESKDAALTITKYIIREFLNMLDEIDWMDEKTKKEAKAKANTVMPVIGYPKELLNNTAVMEVYENLKISSESYFDNIMRVGKWSTDQAFSDLRKPNIKGEWKRHAFVTQVNAYYSPIENSIVFPAGILQKTFFSKDRPQYLNFGAIGVVIGHELTHGFDDQGRQFDKDGNNINWWDETTAEHFKQKAQCIIDQYSNFTTENGMKVNGVNTQSDDIADNGGLKEAYRAYISWTKDNGPEQMLPGLKFNQLQLFWISSANAWCGKYRPEDLKLQIMSGEHSPDEFRVKGPVSNLAEFARDFSCSPDSPMNKRHKCQVW